MLSHGASVWNRIARYRCFIDFSSSLAISEGLFFNYEPQILCQERRPSEKCIQIHKMQLKRNMIRDNISWCEVNRAGQTKQNLKNLTHTKHLFAAGGGGGRGGEGGDSTNFRRVCLHIWKTKQVGIIALKIKRTRIRFLGNVFTAVTVVVSTPF